MRVKLTKLQKAHIKYGSFLGVKFGRLFFREIAETVLSEKPKKTELNFVFACDCGVTKTYNTKTLSHIFNRSTVSCGCQRREQWRRGKFAFLKELEKERMKQ